MLRGAFVPALDRIIGRAGGMDVSFASGRAKADGDILERPAESTHHMALEMGENEEGIVVLHVLADDVLVEVIALGNGDVELAEFVEDIDPEVLGEAMVFDGLPMEFRVLARSAIGRAAFDDRTI